MPIHNLPTISIAISIPLHNILATLEFKVSINETMIVCECCAGSPFTVTAVAVHGTFVTAGDGDADSAAVALGCFGDLWFAGHGESLRRRGHGHHQGQT